MPKQALTEVQVRILRAVAAGKVTRERFTPYRAKEWSFGGSMSWPIRPKTLDRLFDLDYVTLGDEERYFQQIDITDAGRTALAEIDAKKTAL